MSLFYFVTINGNRYRLIRPEAILDQKADIFPTKWTHFISIPLNKNGNFNVKFEEFAQVSKELIPNFDEKTLTAPAKLHLTVCMLRLENKIKVDEAIKILSSKDLLSTLKKEIVHLKGLNIMKGTINKARVVYCEVDDCTKLDKLSVAIMTKLRTSNIIDFEDIPTKWHCTLINTKYSKTSSDGFDVKEMMEAIDTFELGTVLIDEIQLSCLNTHTSKNTENEYYRSECVVKFN